MVKYMITVFDFDDTLFKTKANIYIRDSLTNIILDKFTTSQIVENNKLFNYYVNNSCSIDFSELGDNKKLTKKFLLSAKKIDKYCNKLINLYNSGKKVAILTSRSTDPKLIQDTLQYHLNIHIPLDYIISVNNSKCYLKIKNNHKIFKNKNRKKEGLYYFIKKGYKNIVYYDDDYKNIKIAEELENDLLKLKKKIIIKKYKV